MTTENKNLDIKVEYVTRVEGHGNIVVNVKDGKIEKCEFHVVESPRLFEGMLRGGLLMGHTDIRKRRLFSARKKHLCLVPARPLGVRGGAARWSPRGRQALPAARGAARRRVATL